MTTLPPKPGNYKQPADCERCDAHTDDVWQSGFVIQPFYSEKHPGNPGGKQFVCPGCAVTRALGPVRELPEANDDRLPPARIVRRQRRGGGLAARLHELVDRLLGPDDEAESVALDRSGEVHARAYLARKGFEDARVDLENVILDALKSTGALAQAEEDIADAIGVPLGDAKRALANLQRQGMVYPVGTNGWCYGQRPRGGFRGR